MPFTVSHVAVAAPLARRGLIFSALVAGSIAPDLEYFFRLNTQSQWAHSFPGALLFPFPVALLGLWCFHAFLKQPLLALVPAPARRLLAPYAGSFSFGPARRFGLIVVSLGIGIGVHLFLDSITHDYGAIAQRSVWLQQPLFRNDAQSFLVCDACQALASILMLLALVWQYWRWSSRQRPPSGGLETPTGERDRLLTLYLGIIAVAVIAGLVFAHAHVPELSDPKAYRRFISRMAVASIDTAFVGALLAGQYLLRRRPDAWATASADDAGA